jgi:hypothetical protein
LPSRREQPYSRHLDPWSRHITEAGLQGKFKRPSQLELVNIWSNQFCFASQESAGGFKIPLPWCFGFISGRRSERGQTAFLHFLCCLSTNIRADQRISSFALNITILS